MHHKTSALLVTLLWVRLFLLIAAMPTLAGELPQGVSIKPLGEFPSDVPGVEKIRLVEFRMEPGAKWEGFVAQHTSL